MDTDPYQEVLRVTPGRDNCVNGPPLFHLVNCTPPTVLSDNNTGPTNPDLMKSADGLQFVAWLTDDNGFFTGFSIILISPFLVYSIHYTCIAIDQNSDLGVSNIGMHRIDPFRTIIPLKYEIIGNSQISQSNSRVMLLVLRLQEHIYHDHFIIRWNHIFLHNITILLLSEITLCGDFVVSPLYSMPNISFQNPSVDNNIVNATQSGMITMNCTVSKDGHFVWRWRKVPIILSNSDTGISILTTYSTRSSIITIQSATPGFYQCEVSHATNDKYFSKTFTMLAQSKS